MLSILTYLKELDLMSEKETEADEYCMLFLYCIAFVNPFQNIVDAFVALGGSPTKEGFISKKTLIDIIKIEFELTIDMEVNKITFLINIIQPIGILNETGRR
jgi:hypothetical protein